MEKQSTHENQQNLHVCKIASKISFDLCLQAVKDHGHGLYISDYNKSQCDFYAKMLKARCYEKILELKPSSF